MESLWLRLEELDPTHGRVALFDVPFPDPAGKTIADGRFTLDVLRSPEWQELERRLKNATAIEVGLFDEVGDTLRRMLPVDVVTAWANRRRQAETRTYLEVIRPAAPQKGVRQLADLPWEYLAEKKQGGLIDRYFADPRAPILRGRRGNPEKRDEDARQVNILIISGEPVNWAAGGFPGDDVGAVLREFQRCDLCAHVELLEVPSLDDLTEAFDRLEPDVVHFSGHGEPNKNGVLSLSFEAKKTEKRHWWWDREERRWWWDRNGLWTFLNNRRRKPRLIVLNACDSAASQEGLFSLQEAIIEAGVPAVIAPQAPIQQAVTSEFSQVFYGELLRGETVDVAVAQARIQIGQSKDTEGWDWRDWGLPVLCVSIPPEELFPPKPAQRRDAIQVLNNCAVLRHFMRREGLPAPFVGLGWPKHRWQALKALRSSNCLVIKGPKNGGKSWLVMRTLRDAVHIGHDVKYVEVCGGKTPAVNYVDLLSAIVEADPSHLGSEIHKALDQVCFREFEEERRKQASVDRIVGAFEHGLHEVTKDRELTIVLDQFQREAGVAEVFPDSEFRTILLPLWLKIAQGAVKSLRLIIVVRQDLYEKYGLAVLPGEPLELKLFNQNDVPMLFQELCRFYRKTDLDVLRDAARIMIKSEWDASKLKLLGAMVETQHVP